MRFRLWLPILQTMAMLLVIWAPWAPNPHKIDLVLVDGREVKAWALIPGPDAVDWSLGMNLPAASVVVPTEFAVRENDGPPNYKLRFYGCWLMGVLCWYMVGRFADDLLQWQRSQLLPKKRASDIAFAMLAVPSSILLAGAFIFGGNSSVLTVWGTIWVAIACSALAFRVVQIIQQRRRVPTS